MELRLNQTDLEILSNLLAEKLGEKVRDLIGSTTDRLLSVTELAQRLNVSKNWVYDRNKDRTDNGIPRVYVGKYPRYYLPDVIAWLKKQS